MAAKAEIYVKLETLEEIVNVLQSKKEKGVAITVHINDQTNNYGQNVWAHVKQDKDDNKPRYTVGNGKIFWTDGTVNVASKKEKTPF